MQQRVGLARALAADPDVLMFDEPFSALDPLIRRDMQNEVIRLHHEVGKTMVFITHDLAEALKLGDRILIMRDGEIVQIGTPDEVVAAAGRRLRARLRQRRTQVARAHPEVGHARRRRARRRTARSSSPDQIVRDAARVVLDHQGPCRVADGDKHRRRRRRRGHPPGRGRGGGGDVVTTTTLPPGGATRGSSACQQGGAAGRRVRQQPPHRRQAAGRSWSSGCVLYSLFKGKNTKALRFQDTDRRCTASSTRPATGSSSRARTTGSSAGCSAGSATSSTRWCVFFQELIAIPAPPRPVPEIGWIGVVALAAWVTYVFAGIRSTILVTLSMLVVRRLRACGRTAWTR